MSLADRISATLHLPQPARLVLAALYERQPATPAQLTDRTGLPAHAVQRGLRELEARAILRGHDYVWVDLAPALRAIAEAPPITALFPSEANEVSA